MGILAMNTLYGYYNYKTHCMGIIAMKHLVWVLKLGNTWYGYYTLCGMLNIRASGYSTDISTCIYLQRICTYGYVADTCTCIYPRCNRMRGYLAFRTVLDRAVLFGGMDRHIWT